MFLPQFETNRCEHDCCFSFWSPVHRKLFNNRVQLLLSTCHSASGTMAGPIPREEALKRGGADLRFTLSRNDVEDDLQAAFFTNGITTIQKFFFLL